MKLFWGIFMVIIMFILSQIYFAEERKTSSIWTNLRDVIRINNLIFFFTENSKILREATAGKYGLWPASTKNVSLNRWQYKDDPYPVWVTGGEEFAQIWPTSQVR